MRRMLTDADYAGQRVGRTLCSKYTLEALIGVGGMAAVYKGSHRNGHRVAIKMLHPAVSASEMLRTRFLREGYAANAVDHPGAVRVLDDDVAEDGSVFLVMELLSGTTMTSLWETLGYRLPLNQTVRLSHQLLDVLASAHVKGIVHRDIKPDNLWVSTDGRLRVLDFGIARMRDGMGASATRTGGIMGTPAFMPREQALGLVKEIDGRTDLWAVGATMFTMLSGRTVHQAETPEGVVVMTATMPAPALASVVPEVPPAVAAVVNQALAFERDHRFPDARAMQAALEQAYYASTGQTLGATAPYGSALAGGGQTVLAPTPPMQAPLAQTPGLRPSSTTGGVAAAQTGGSAAPGAKPGAPMGLVLALVAGVVAVAAGGLVFLEGAHGHAAAAASAAAAAPPAPSPLPPPVPTPAAPPEPPPMAAPAAPAPDDHLAAPSAESAAPAPSAVHAHLAAPPAAPHVAPATPKPATPKPATAAPAPAPAVNCDPPWYIDPVSHGRKVKPGC